MYQLLVFITERQNSNLHSFVAKCKKMDLRSFWGKLSLQIPAARKVSAFPCTGNGNGTTNLPTWWKWPLPVSGIGSHCPGPLLPPSLSAFHHHLKGSDYTLCTVLQYNKHYLIRLHWWNCSAVQPPPDILPTRRESRSPALARKIVNITCFLSSSF